MAKAVETHPPRYADAVRGAPGAAPPPPREQWFRVQGGKAHKVQRFMRIMRPIGDTSALPSADAGMKDLADKVADILGAPHADGTCQLTLLPTSGPCSQGGAIVIGFTPRDCDGIKRRARPGSLWAQRLVTELNVVVKEHLDRREPESRRELLRRFDAVVRAARAAGTPVHFRNHHTAMVVGGQWFHLHGPAPGQLPPPPPRAAGAPSPGRGVTA